ncbi:S-protein homolog 3 [Linum grandiflorum]
MAIIIPTKLLALVCAMTMMITAGRCSHQEVLPTIHLTNNLTLGKTLNAHCRSKDNDIGLKQIAPGCELSWSFSSNFFCTTLFWCHLYVEDKFLIFDVYNCKKYKNPTRWSVRDRGVYSAEFQGSCQAVKTLELTNKLGKILIVHCRSADDDIHAQAIEPGSTLRWSFDINISSSTLFWCRLAVGDKRLSFDIYNSKAVGNPTRWLVNDDGVYSVDYYIPHYPWNH